MNGDKGKEKWVRVVKGERNRSSLSLKVMGLQGGWESKQR